METEDMHISLGKHLELETVVVDNSKLEPLLRKIPMRFIRLIAHLPLERKY